MEPLLFLTHRLPYPPNKGDKIRSYHELRYLAQHYRVMLGTFIDDPADWTHVDTVRAWCEALCVLPLHPKRARLGSARGLLNGQALTLPYYHRRALARWVHDVVTRHLISQAVIFSSPMAQYVQPYPHLHVVADFCDVDSAKWTQYADSHRWPMSWVYRREGKKLLAYERQVAAASAATVLVTPAEVALLANQAPEVAQRLHAMGNGVDTNFFAPDATRVNPYSADEIPVVFSGAMDYWPNIDAVTWFVQDVLPQVRAQAPNAKFYIVGMNPAPAVQALAQSPDVVVTGRVADIRPYVQYARVVVAPLRVARGVQNKVLEAMALARPVVVSSVCAEGVGGASGADYLTADGATQFAQKVVECLSPEVGVALGQQARHCVEKTFRWEAHLNRLGQLLQARAQPVHCIPHAEGLPHVSADLTGRADAGR